MIGKNGNISSTSLYEPNAMLINKKYSASYTPTKGANNNCMTCESIIGFEEGKKYYVELVISWNGFKTDVASNFSISVQGSNYTGTAWAWQGVNPLCNAIISCFSSGLKNLVLSADKGSFVVKAFFTANTYTGYQLGIRTNYSNGIGNIGISNLKIIPAEYAIDNVTTSGMFGKDKVVMTNFIEN